MSIVCKCPEMGIEFPDPSRVSNGLRLEVVRAFDELQKHAPAWNRLVEVSGQRPELSHAWIVSHLEARLQPGDSWFCLLAYEGERLVGVLPVVTVPRRWFGRYKCLRFEAPSDIFNTGAVETLMRRGHEETVFPLFLRYLWNIPCACCGLRFRGIPAARLPETICRRRFPGSTVVTEQTGYEGVLPISGSADEYFKTLSKNFYRNYRRIGRRIEEHPDVRFRFETGNAEINAEQFMEIEHQGWKAQRRTSIRSDESYVQFFRLLTKQMEEQGWLRWAFLDIDGEPAAGQFMVQRGEVLYVVKIGYNEKFSKLSPGAALFGCVIEKAFDAREVKEINFMSGYPWMKDWHVQMRDLTNIAFFPDSVRKWGLCKQMLQLRLFLNRLPRLRKTIDRFSTRLMHKTGV